MLLRCYDWCYHDLYNCWPDLILVMLLRWYYWCYHDLYSCWPRLILVMLLCWCYWCYMTCTIVDPTTLDYGTAWISSIWFEFTSLNRILLQFHRFNSDSVILYHRTLVLVVLCLLLSLRRSYFSSEYRDREGCGHRWLPFKIFSLSSVSVCSIPWVYTDCLCRSDCPKLGLIFLSVENPSSAK